jgi:hypothetical protein
MCCTLSTLWVIFHVHDISGVGPRLSSDDCPYTDSFPALLMEPEPFRTLGQYTEHYTTVVAQK